jgi:sirohydrochlorin ferrochelatase
MTPALVLLAHGTGDAAGRATIGRLLVALRDALPGTDVRMAYAGVARPQLADVLGRADPVDGPAVVVPCFLAAGYHVRVDVPGQLAELGRGDVILAEPLGPDPALLDVAVDRLHDAGVRPDDHVVLAAAGSTDPVARADLDTAAGLLAARRGAEVPVGYIAGGSPRVADVVAVERTPGRRMVLATWLLAPGAFHRWLGDAGADVVTEPLGDHPGVVDVVIERYRAACGAVSVR